MTQAETEKSVCNLLTPLIKDDSTHWSSEDGDSHHHHDLSSKMVGAKRKLEFDVNEDAMLLVRLKRAKKN